MARPRKDPALVSQARAKVAREAWAALTPEERSGRAIRAAARRGKGYPTMAIDWEMCNRERRFWEKVYAAAVAGDCQPQFAGRMADAALKEWRDRFATGKDPRQVGRSGNPDPREIRPGADSSGELS